MVRADCDTWQQCPEEKLIPEGRFYAGDEVPLDVAFFDAGVADTLTCMIEKVPVLTPQQSALKIAFWQKKFFQTRLIYLLKSFFKRSI